MERGFLSSGRRDVKQKKSTSVVGSTMENTSANEATTSTCNVEHNFESNIEQANDVTMNKGVADSCTTHQRIWLSNPTSLAAKICDIESQMLKGKLVFMGDDEKPLKSKSVYEPVNSVGAAALSNDNFVKAIDGANLTGNGAVSYVYLLDGEPVAYPVVENYAKNTWSKYRLVRTMMNSKDLFFFMFSSKDVMDAMLENGPWLIRNVLLILKK
ncbi:gag-pol polyprotein [Tanacetum coccineum]